MLNINYHSKLVNVLTCLCIKVPMWLRIKKIIRTLTLSHLNYDLFQ